METQQKLAQSWWQLLHTFFHHKSDACVSFPPRWFKVSLWISRTFAGGKNKTGFTIYCFVWQLLDSRGKKLWNLVLHFQQIYKYRNYIYVCVCVRLCKGSAVTHKVTLPSIAKKKKAWYRKHFIWFIPLVRLLMMYTMHLSGSIHFKLVITVCLQEFPRFPLLPFGFSYQSWENAVQTRNRDV